MTSKSTIGAAIARAREPGCDYPGCVRPGSFLFWARLEGKGSEFVARVCAMHNRPLARSTAADHVRRRLLRRGGPA